MGRATAAEACPGKGSLRVARPPGGKDTGRVAAGFTQLSQQKLGVETRL